MGDASLYRLAGCFSTDIGTCFLLNYPKIYLASSSPRRQELLRQIGIEYEFMPADISEEVKSGESAEQYVLRAAAEKADFVMQRVREKGLPLRPVLGADTVVVVEDDILGKPRDRAEAKAMLKRLSGHRHRVLTAIAVVHDGITRTAVSISRVAFADLSDDVIDRYWDSGEPKDKAGAYAIQGAGAMFVSDLEGSYSGVVGLPLYELGQLLSRFGLNRR